MNTITNIEEKLTQYERMEYEACLEHFEQLLIQADKSKAVYQMVMGLVSPQERQWISGCEVLELLWDRVKLDNICPDENPCVPHVSNGYNVISILCDFEMEVFDKETNEPVEVDITLIDQRSGEKELIASGTNLIPVSFKSE